MTQALMECEHCGGEVVMQAGRGRSWDYRPGITLELPEAQMLPTCQNCGETYLTTAETEALEQALESVFLDYCRDLIRTVRERSDVNARELERALGVTPTYLSHLMAGRKTASLPLVRLLQAFARYPDEVQRHLDGNDWKAAVLSPPQAPCAYDAAPRVVEPTVTSGKHLKAVPLTRSAYTPQASSALVTGGKGQAA